MVSKLIFFPVEVKREWGWPRGLAHEGLTRFFNRTKKVLIGLYVSLISTRSRYGLRFLIDLAEHDSGSPVDLGSVAERQEISLQYLSKLVIPLKSAGIIRAARGAKGGYELAKRPESIDLWSIVEVLEGRSSLLECTASPEACERSGDCRSLPVWLGLDKVVVDYLRNISLADVAGPAAPDYVI